MVIKNSYWLTIVRSWRWNTSGLLPALVIASPPVYFLSADVVTIARAYAFLDVNDGQFLVIDLVHLS